MSDGCGNTQTTAAKAQTTTKLQTRVKQGGDVTQLVESDILYTLFGRITSDRHAADACFIPRCGKGFFSQSKLSMQTLTVFVHPRVQSHTLSPAYVKDFVVHVRVWWIMETLKHQACTVGRVARLCRSWLSPGKANRISHGRNPIGTLQL